MSDTDKAPGVVDIWLESLLAFNRQEMCSEMSTWNNLK